MVQEKSESQSCFVFFTAGERHNYIFSLVAALTGNLSSTSDTMVVLLSGIEPDQFIYFILSIALLERRKEDEGCKLSILFVLFLQ